MRLIIDIPEKVNEHIRSAVGHGYYPFFDDDEGHIVGKAISNGTPIPDNATVYNIEQIRAEIQQMADNYAEPFEMGAYYHCLKIIDDYTKGEPNDLR